MCGFAGLARVDGLPADRELLQRMTDAIAHRGPDGDGFYVDGPVGLGHRRLAIIDLVTGDQPMESDDGMLCTVFNGEIYNYRELRAELAAEGAAFRTTSDTEVILRAYERFGRECLQHLRGMFAFALWDKRRRELFIARDRVGIKPLVYAWDGRRLHFGSELKALLQDPTLARELDWDALRDYLVYQYVPSPQTIFRGVRKLEPASYLVLSLERGTLETRRYWDLRFRPDRTVSEADWEAGLRDVLAESVRQHMVADVPIGAFLSGGLDSSTVVAFMARAAAGRVRTFSIGFDEESFDELAFARQVATRFGTEHSEYVVKPDALEVLPLLAAQFDEPFADSSAIPTYYVSKITREQVTVALSGDGGDENFAGYRRYARAQALHERFDHGAGRLVRPLLALGARLLPQGMRGRGYLELLGEDELARYFRMVTAHDTADLRRVLTRDACRHMTPEASPEHFRRLAAEAKAPDYVSALQALDIRTYLPEDILTKVDRTSMMVSLEARVPLLDHVLMEFMATMPVGLKMREGAGKAILRRVMAADLPEDVLSRRKMGFGVPLGAWFRRELAGYARDVLLDRRTRERGVFDPRALAALLDEHQAGPRDRSAQIWSLLAFEEWARRWWHR
jgi:asparagine synthase (glutamine-hydrolysing)